MEDELWYTNPHNYMYGYNGYTIGEVYTEMLKSERGQGYI